MPTSEKRSVSKTVKMTPSDYALLKRAAKALWPEDGASDSRTIVTLARMGARAALEKKRKG